MPRIDRDRSQWEKCHSGRSLNRPSSDAVKLTSVSAAAAGRDLQWWASSFWRKTMLSLARSVKGKFSRIASFHTSAATMTKHHLMCGTWVKPGVIITVSFDTETLKLELVKKTAIEHDEPISWMSFDVGLMMRVVAKFNG